MGKRGRYIARSREQIDLLVAIAVACSDLLWLGAARCGIFMACFNRVSQIGKKGDLFGQFENKGATKKVSSYQIWPPAADSSSSLNHDFYILRTNILFLLLLHFLWFPLLFSRLGSAFLRFNFLPLISDIRIFSPLFFRPNGHIIWPASDFKVFKSCVG